MSIVAPPPPPLNGHLYGAAAINSVMNAQNLVSQSIDTTATTSSDNEAGTTSGTYHQHNHRSTRRVQQIKQGNDNSLKMEGNNTRRIIFPTLHQQQETTSWGFLNNNGNTKPNSTPKQVCSSTKHVYVVPNEITTRPASSNISNSNITAINTSSYNGISSKDTVMRTASLGSSEVVVIRNKNTRSSKSGKEESLRSELLPLSDLLMTKSPSTVPRRIRTTTTTTTTVQQQPTPAFHLPPQPKFRPLPPQQLQQPVFRPIPPQQQPIFRPPPQQPPAKLTTSLHTFLQNITPKSPVSGSPKQQKLTSCLRRGKFSSGNEEQQDNEFENDDGDLGCCKISSVESDIPSLASSTVSDVCSMPIEEEKICSFHDENNTKKITPPPTPLRSFLESSTSPLESSSISSLSKPTLPKQRPLRLSKRSLSEPTKGVHFDPRVWVREFERSTKELDTTWFTSEEMNDFKTEAMLRIMQYNTTAAKQSSIEFVPTGTGRIVQKTVPVVTATNRPPANAGEASQQQQKLLFSHQALRMESEFKYMPSNMKQQLQLPLLNVADSIRTEKDKNHVSFKTKVFRQAVTDNEVRDILIVDPHAICADLFVKGLSKIFPQATIVTATNAKQAKLMTEEKCKCYNGHGYDLILIEERLQSSSTKNQYDDSSNSNFTGSTLLRTLRVKESLRNVEQQQQGSITSNVRSLYIGVTAHVHDDRHKLIQNGADLVWSKPPPKMNDVLRDQVLKILLTKRGRKAVANELFN